jgi:heat shock protein HtpX
MESSHRPPLKQGGGTFVLRIALFLLTNLAVLIVVGLVFEFLGLGRLLQREGLAIDLPGLLAVAAVIGFSGALLSLALSRWMAKTFTGARVITRPTTPTERWLIERVAALARRLGLGMPEVAIYPGDELNAFATGARRHHALVAVSTGMLERMGPEDVEAVLGHEMSHVANGDMVTLTLLQGVVNTFVIFLSRLVGLLVDRLLLRSDRDRGNGPGYFLTALVSQLILGFLASLVVLWFSRRRELRADDGGADLLGPRRMARALRDLGTDAAPGVLPDSLRILGIRPRPRRSLGRLLMSHPPLEERIARLEARERAGL